MLVVQQPASAVMRGNASYLITGAFGGLGLLVARWMASRGAKRLVLVGRSGPTTAEAASAVSEIQASGCVVVVEKADVSSAADMKRVVEKANEVASAPLIGVIHAPR